MGELHFPNKGENENFTSSDIFIAFAYSSRGVKKEELWSKMIEPFYTQLTKKLLQKKNESCVEDFRVRPLLLSFHKDLTDIAYRDTVDWELERGTDPEVLRDWGHQI